MGIAGSSRFQEGKQHHEMVSNPKGKTASSVSSHWVRANSWVICVLVLTLLVEDGNTNPTEVGAEADPSPLTGACLARKVSLPSLRW